MTWQTKTWSGTTGQTRTDMCGPEEDNERNDWNDWTDVGYDSDNSYPDYDETDVED